MKASSPMSMLKAKQRQTLKRTSSCPDMHQIIEIVAAKNKNHHQQEQQFEEQEVFSKSSIKTIDESPADDAAGDDTIIQDVSSKAVNAAVQTDEFLVSPYEHLFPFVIPQWIPNSTTDKSIEGVSRKVTSDTATPYVLLDHYIEAAYKSTGDQETDLGKLREEIALLHSQLLYERHRRETLGLRNRRLLGKTKSSRVLEEQNTSLVSTYKLLLFHLASCNICTE